MLVLNLRPKNPPPWAHQEAPDRVSDLVEVPPDALLPTDGDAKVIISLIVKKYPPSLPLQSDKFICNS